MLCVRRRLRDARPRLGLPPPRPVVGDVVGVGVVVVRGNIVGVVVVVELLWCWGSVGGVSVCM